MAENCNCNTCNCDGGSSNQKIIKTTFLLRRGTTAAWESANPILQYGEPGYEKDTGKLKIGDGIHPWNELPYLTGSGDPADINVDNKSIVINDTQISLKGFDEAEVGQIPTVGQDGELEWISAPFIEEFQELEERVAELENNNIDLAEDTFIIYGGSASEVIIDAHSAEEGN